MCMDLKAAAENRERIKQKRNIEYYIWIENLVKAWPHDKPLPNVIHEKGTIKAVLTGVTILYVKLPTIDKS